MSIATEKLREVQDQLDAGKTPATTVRDLLNWFSYNRRGRWVVREIRDSLHKASLHTDPDFEYAWIDAPIRFLGGNSQPTTRIESVETVLQLNQTADETVDRSEASPQLASGANAYADPTYRIGRLPAANKVPTSIKPDKPISEAVTIMLRHDYSQLPVMTNERDVRGLVSWKSLSLKLALDAACASVDDCMTTSVEIVSDDMSLFRVIDKIIQEDCVLVRDRTRKITGIVTATDLSETFHQLGRPFLLLGEIENHIRGLMDGKFTPEELQQFRYSGDGGHEIQDVSDLNFGQYVRILQEPSRWERIGLKIDRVIFIQNLEKVNRIRNDVMHFDPDGISDEDLEELRITAKFLQELRAVRREA
jgi:CBS domain-containing protein